MNTQLKFLIAALVAVGAAVAAYSQPTPRTLDAVQEIASDGTISLNIRMAFDAQPWLAWKAMVGDSPSRLRASFQHQFAAFAIEDFKVERDDMNRSAQISMRSPSGPEIRKDGSFRIPIEKEFRLVNNTGREWFFSGINPYAGNSLNTMKVVLPANLINASLVNAGTSEQALIYTLAVAPGLSRTLVIAGVVVLVLGIAILLFGLFFGRKTAKAATQPPPVSAPPVANIS